MAITSYPAARSHAARKATHHGSRRFLQSDRRATGKDFANAAWGFHAFDTPSGVCEAYAGVREGAGGGQRQAEVASREQGDATAPLWGQMAWASAVPWA